MKRDRTHQSEVLAVGFIVAIMVGLMVWGGFVQKPAGKFELLVPPEDVQPILVSGYREIYCKSPCNANGTCDSPCAEVEMPKWNEYAACYQGSSYCRTECNADGSCSSPCPEEEYGTGDCQYYCAGVATYCKKYCAGMLPQCNPCNADGSCNSPLPYPRECIERTYKCGQGMQVYSINPANPAGGWQDRTNEFSLPPGVGGLIPNFFFVGSFRGNTYLIEQLVPMSWRSWGNWRLLRFDGKNIEDVTPFFADVIDDVRILEDVICIDGHDTYSYVDRSICSFDGQNWSDVKDMYGDFFPLQSVGGKKYAVKCETTPNSDNYPEYYTVTKCDIYSSSGTGNDSWVVEADGEKIISRYLQDVGLNDTIPKDYTFAMDVSLSSGRGNLTLKVSFYLSPPDYMYPQYPGKLYLTNVSYDVLPAFGSTQDSLGRNITSINDVISIDNSDGEMIISADVAVPKEVCNEWGCYESYEIESVLLDSNGNVISTAVYEPTDLENIVEANGGIYFLGKDKTTGESALLSYSSPIVLTAILPLVGIQAGEGSYTPDTPAEEPSCKDKPDCSDCKNADGEKGKCYDGKCKIREDADEDGFLNFGEYKDDDEHKCLGDCLDLKKPYVEDLANYDENLCAGATKESCSDPKYSVCGVCINKPGRGPDFGLGVPGVDGVCVCNDGYLYPFTGGLMKCIKVKLNRGKWLETKKVEDMPFAPDANVLGIQLYDGNEFYKAGNGETTIFAIDVEMKNIQFGDKLDIKGDILVEAKGNRVNLGGKTQSSYSNTKYVFYTSPHYNYLGKVQFSAKKEDGLGFFFKAWNGENWVQYVATIPSETAGTGVSPIYMVPLFKLKVTAYGIPTDKTGKKYEDKKGAARDSLVFLSPFVNDQPAMRGGFPECKTEKDGTCTFKTTKEGKEVPLYLVGKLLETDNPLKYKLQVWDKLIQNWDGSLGGSVFLKDKNSGETTSEPEEAVILEYEASETEYTQEIAFLLPPCDKFASKITNKKGREEGRKETSEMIENFGNVIDSAMTELCKFSLEFNNNVIQVGKTKCPTCVPGGGGAYTGIPILDRYVINTAVQGLNTLVNIVAYIALAMYRGKVNLANVPLHYSIWLTNELLPSTGILVDTIQGVADLIEPDTKWSAELGSCYRGEKGRFLFVTWTKC